MDLASGNSAGSSEKSSRRSYDDRKPHSEDRHSHRRPRFVNTLF